jgi:hypothetical protein
VYRGATETVIRRIFVMVNDKISAGCRILKYDNQLKETKDRSLFTVSIAKVSTEKEADRQWSLDKRKQEAEYKKYSYKCGAPKSVFLMVQISQKGRYYIKKLTVGQLKMSLQYQFKWQQHQKELHTRLDCRAGLS